MHALLLAAVVALGSAADEAPKGKAIDLEGKWLILHVEEYGAANTALALKPATIKGNTLTYGSGKKALSLELTFGPHHSVHATLTGGGLGKGKKGHGVYVASKNYLCLSLNTDEDKKEDKEGGDKTAARKEHRAHGADIVLVLRRQRSE